MHPIFFPSHQKTTPSRYTHTIESFTCSQSFCPRSHEITITSSDTHTIESFTCMLTIFLPSHEITITSSDTHTIESFTFSQSHHAADIYSYFFKFFTIFLPFFVGFA